ncbi:DUF4240 domain-containing protein [Thioclava sp. FR2]|uniref:DUF4240 domain-containing protein n=1 Tax=Thioclava sp. FR2 TaxID=3445780 RepID=UPI003EBB14D7
MRRSPHFTRSWLSKTFALDTKRHYAAYSFIPGLSDSFLYTRLAVVARGKLFYESVLQDPSKFPGWSTGAWFETLMYIPAIAFRDVTGDEFERDSSVSIESFSNIDGWK